MSTVLSRWFRSRSPFVGLLGLFALLLGVVVPVTPAAASPQQCIPPANGFVRVTSATGGTVRGYRTFLEGPVISLQTKNVGGRQTAYAVLASRLTVPGDQFWMDWWPDNRRPNGWIQCGPFSITTYGQTGITYGKATSTSRYWVMRACGRMAGADISRCTDWW